MNTNPINSTLATQPGLGQFADAAGADTSAGDKALSSDFETFLRMLTVQLQNQDPLNPVEASDYAVQLATFSGVEQQVRTNELLGGLGEQFNMLGLSQFAGWIGMEVLHEGQTGYSGQDIEIRATIPAGSETAQLVVKDSFGTEVARKTLPDLGGEYSWDGVGNDGLEVPAGQYAISVEGFSGGVLTGTQPASSFETVSQVHFDGGEPILTLAGGTEVRPGDVTGMRGAPSP